MKIAVKCSYSFLGGIWEYRLDSGTYTFGILFRGVVHCVPRAPLVRGGDAQPR